MSLNNRELQAKVRSVLCALVKEKGYASSVDVLMSLGYLTKEHYENWRFGVFPTWSVFARST